MDATTTEEIIMVFVALGAIWLVLGFFMWCAIYETIIEKIVRPWKYILIHTIMGPFGWCILLGIFFLTVLHWTTLDKKIVKFFST